jgi:hypothetical protein
MQFDLTELRDSAVVDSIQRLADITFAEYLELITPLLVYVAGMSVYALFVFSFYRYLARRDLVKLRQVHYLGGVVGFLERAGHVVFNFVENIVIAPILVFFWFAFMATVLVLLSKRYSAESVMLISAAVVSVVRISAYYTEELSQDVAKMIPFALLGIFIVDMSYFDWQASLEVARQLPAFWGTLVYYLAFIVALEMILRSFKTIYRLLIPGSLES